MKDRVHATPFSDRRDRIRRDVALRGVFYRLIFSYAALVFLVAMAVASASYAFFQAKYKDELESLQTINVNHAEAELRSQVVDVATTVYLECVAQLSRDTGDFFAPHDHIVGNSAKLYFTYHYLSDLVSRYIDVLEDVHLYYLDSDLVISSREGIQYQSGEGDRAKGAYWLKELSGQENPRLWIKNPRRDVTSSTFGGGVTALQCYPLLADTASCSAIVAIDIRADILRNSLLSLSTKFGGTSFIIGEDGTIFFSSVEENEVSEPFRNMILEAAQHSINDPFSRMYHLSSASYLVAALPITESQWFLVDATPLNHLYRKGDSIKYVILFICVSGIALGLAISVFLTSRIYDPLGRLIERVRGLFGNHIPPPTSSQDEYFVLDYAIDGLKNQMDKLSAVLLANRPMIRHEFMTRLIHGDFQDIAELRGALSLLAPLELPSPCAIAVVAIVDAGTADISRVAKYRLAEALEIAGDRIRLCSPLSGSILVAVVDESELDESAFKSLVESWIEVAARTCDIVAAATLGSAVDSPLLLEQSYEEARVLDSYRFLFPDERVLVDRRDLLERENTAMELPKTVFDSFEEALKLKNEQKVREILSSAVDSFLERNASVDFCKYELRRFSNAIVSYAEEIRAENIVEIRARLDRINTESPYIDKFITNLVGEITALFNYLNVRSEDRGVLLVEKVKKYIEENFRDNISLDSAAEAVCLSSSYLSKIFKERTGKNFVSYVTDIRLAEAEKLLRTSNAAIQEVGLSAGFRSPAYFIHQFKVRYGLTPVDYRRSSM